MLSGMSKVSVLALFLSTFSSLISPALGATHQVYVGDDTSSSSSAHTYEPPTLSANVNDTIVFIFRGNHTVTEASYSSPCAHTAASTFDSGGLIAGQNFSIVVSNNKPIWIRCSDFCDTGMVAAVNAPDSGDTTYAQFQANALNSSSTSPTSSIPVVTLTSTTSTTTTTSSPPATSSTGAAPSQFAMWPMSPSYAAVISSLDLLLAY